MKDKYQAKLAFWLSMGFWVPMFNVALCTISIWYAVMAIKKINKDPKSYGGFGFALTALIIGITAIFLTIIGTILYFMRPEICGSSVCQAYLTQ